MYLGIISLAKIPKGIEPTVEMWVFSTSKIVAQGSQDVIKI
jgi:hypothetical protein